jgi:hypothetical protein
MLNWALCRKSFPKHEDQRCHNENRRYHHDERENTTLNFRRGYPSV